MRNVSVSKIAFLSPLLALGVGMGAFISASAMAYSQSLNSHAPYHMSNIADITDVHAYAVEDFSADYKAVVTVDNRQHDARTTINIIDKATGHTVLSQPSDIDIEYELKISEEMNKGNVINANVAQAPYGHFSGIIYDDFNFDHQKDIAIKDGHMGCYGGSSYQVYLKQGNGFEHSDGFTELAQGYCGFFDIDHSNKTLHTMTKSGAAWHQYSTFKVINNKPVAVHIIEEDWSNDRGLLAITEKTRVNGEMQVEEYETLPEVDIPDDSGRYVYSYRVENDKIMVLKDNGKHLSYAFADKDGRIELYYDGQFVYDDKAQSLSFTNTPVIYHISNQGIAVKLPSRTVMLPAQPSSIRGRLKHIDQFTNVEVK